jgi:methionyl-tRNA formyltransferase
MRTVFFGSPEAALPSLRALIEAGHGVGLVVTQPDRPAGRGKRPTLSPVKRLALMHGLPVFQPDRIRRDPDAIERLRAARAEAFVVVAYGQILPGEMIGLPPFGAINVHFSLLPKYRGAAPVQAAILAGETATGVTIFRLNEKMDEGDILSARETEIPPTETAGELESRLASLGAGLLLETMASIGTLVARPQDHARATSAPKLRKEEGRIDWTLYAADIDRRVRAFTPRPSAFTFHMGQRLIVLKGAPSSEGLPTGAPGPASALPGAIRRVTKRGFEVQAGAGSLYWIEALRPESRDPLDAYTYSLNGRVTAGEKLG